MKISWNPKEISKNPKKAYQNFYSTVTNAVKRKQSINDSHFYAEFKTFADVYEKQAKTEELTTMSRSLIEYFVSQGQNNLAGIAYSILIKLNYKNPQVVETLALNGLAIAKRANDPVHIASRARDLVDLYERTNRGSDEHIKYLRLANKALTDVCKNYSTSVNSRFNSISRTLKPLENYELMLCTTKLDIVKYTYKQDIFNAKGELEKAKALYEKNKNSANVKTLGILSRRIAKWEAEIN